MALRLKLPDDEYVERLRRVEARRRRDGFIAASLGLALILIASGTFTWFLYHWTPFNNADHMNFAMGLLFGGLFAGTAYKGGHILAISLASVLVPDRKTQLLIRLWDESDSRPANKIV